MPKPTQQVILDMKKNIFAACESKQMKWKEGAALLGMHPKALSRLKGEYTLRGDSALIGARPGPKEGSVATNRTPESVEQLVKELALNFRGSGPIGLSEKMLEYYGIRLDPSTVWRILKRRQVRYTTEYHRWKKEPKLYCLDTPGEELQLDGCYPFGKARPLVSFDAIDDCSRIVFGRCYTRETAENAIAFVSELINRVPFSISRIRVDNRYGKKLKAFCESLGIEVIENQAYTPQQNGKIERFHRTLKDEFFYVNTSFTDTMEEINYKYSLWLTQYNTKRKHHGMGMNGLTPAQKVAVTYLQSIANTYQAEPKKVTGILQQYRCRQIANVLLASYRPFQRLG